MEWDTVFKSLLVFGFVMLPVLTAFSASALLKALGLSEALSMPDDSHRPTAAIDPYPQFEAANSQESAPQNRQSA